jgi:ArsR family transcriptional regulator
MSFDEEELAKQLWALGDRARLKILGLLSTGEDCKNGCNVSQIAEKLGLAQPTVSHHLRVLRQAGIIENKKRCRDVFYWIKPSAAVAIVAALEEILADK